MNESLTKDTFVKDLLVALESPDAQTRHTALHRLVESGVRADQRFFEPLMKAAHDPQMRFIAIIGLGQVDDFRSFAVLRTLFDQTTESTVRYAAGRALGVFHSDEAIAILLEALESPEATRRIAAAEAFWRSGDERAIGPLITVLHDENHMVTVYSLMALGAMRAQAAILPLLALLADPATHTDFAKIHILPYLVGALGNIGDPQAVDPLLAILAKHDDGSFFAAAALGEIGDPRAFEPLLATLKNPNRNLAAWAASALGRLGDSRALTPLLEAMRDSSDLVRIAAARGLGDLGDPAAVPVLAWAVAHDEGVDSEAGDSVHDAAVAALQVIASQSQ